MTEPGAERRALPSVDLLLRQARAAALLACYPRALVVEALRASLAEARAALAVGGDPPPADALLARAAQWLQAVAAPSLRPVVNAAGVVLHTNLGRAVLCDDAIAALVAATGPCNLEMQLDSGERGERDEHVEGLACALTGAEAATVVNNNAAAVLLALNTLADGREVIVSRGELIEIGGAFRLPDVLAKSGAVLREVGTTNRTHLHDYERAIGERTALILKVHPSNYRVEGFTAAVDLDALVALGGRRGVAVMEDLGSGALVDLSTYDLPPEPVVADRVRLGADVVTLSADKLLGGPQAGIAVGRAAVIERLRRNPLKRALRCDKLTLAALAATLRCYRTAPDLAAALPTLRWLTRPVEEMERVGAAAVAMLRPALGPEYEIEVIPSVAAVGSGAQPASRLPSRAIAIVHPRLAPLAIAARFRAASPPIVGRVHDGRFLLDLRCIGAAEELVPRAADESAPRRR